MLPTPTNDLDDNGVSWAFPIESCRPWTPPLGREEQRAHFPLTALTSIPCLASTKSPLPSESTTPLTITTTMFSMRPQKKKNMNKRLPKKSDFKEKNSRSDIAFLFSLGLPEAQVAPIHPSKLISKKIKKPKKDRFVPKRDPQFERQMGPVESDNDIWVERFYMNKEGGRTYYFRSVNTLRCVFMDPPTGSGTVIFWDELEEYPMLRQFATEPLGERLEVILERPDYEGPRYKERRQLQKKAEAKKIRDESTSSESSATFRSK